PESAEDVRTRVLMSAGARPSGGVRFGWPLRIAGAIEVLSAADGCPHDRIASGEAPARQTSGTRPVLRARGRGNGNRASDRLRLNEDGCDELGFPDPLRADRGGLGAEPQVRAGLYPLLAQRRRHRLDRRVDVPAERGDARAAGWPLLR